MRWARRMGTPTISAALPPDQDPARRTDGNPVARDRGGHDPVDARLDAALEAQPHRAIDGDLRQPRLGGGPATGRDEPDAQVAQQPVDAHGDADPAGAVERPR